MRSEIRSKSNPLSRQLPNNDVFGNRQGFGEITLASNAVEREQSGIADLGSG